MDLLVLSRYILIVVTIDRSFKTAKQESGIMKLVYYQKITNFVD
jgi:hypothetical protein